jgi:hypothetical protein
LHAASLFSKCCCRRSSSRLETISTFRWNSLASPWRLAPTVALLRAGVSQRPPRVCVPRESRLLRSRTGGASADHSPVKGKPKRRGSARLLLVQAHGDRSTADGTMDPRGNSTRCCVAVERLRVPDYHAAHHPFCPPGFFWWSACREWEGRVFAASDAGRFLTASDSQPDPISVAPASARSCSSSASIAAAGVQASSCARAVSSSTIHTRGLALSPPRRCTSKSAPARPLFSRPAPDNLTSPQQAIRLCLTRPARCIRLAAPVVHSLQHACLHPSIQHHRR